MFIVLLILHNFLPIDSQLALFPKEMNINLGAARYSRRPPLTFLARHQTEKRARQLREPLQSIVLEEELIKIAALLHPLVNRFLILP